MVLSCSSVEEVNHLGWLGPFCRPTGGASSGEWDQGRKTLKSERMQHGLEKLSVALREVLGLQYRREEEETEMFEGGGNPPFLSGLFPPGRVRKYPEHLLPAAPRRWYARHTIIWTLQPHLLRSSWQWARRLSGCTSNRSGQGAIPAVVVCSQIQPRHSIKRPKSRHLFLLMLRHLKNSVSWQPALNSSSHFLHAHVTSSSFVSQFSQELTKLLKINIYKPPEPFRFLFWSMFKTSQCHTLPKHLASHKVFLPLK